MAGGSAPLAATPPGVADVLNGFCQQDPPAEGYTVAAFDQRIAHLADEQERLVAAGDRRSVFHLVYLSFSRQVRRGFDLGRFVDEDFAADMSCRFIDAYLQQALRFTRSDPTQCTAWRRAFGLAASGEANVIQAMFLGMNAHIHYDLAFVTLGSAAAAGDLVGDPPGGDRHGRTTLSRTGLPDERHLDFLVINQIAWESLADIREAVLRQFSLPLQIGGRVASAVTDVVGQRVLMEARDTAWRHATLLIHAADVPQRSAIGELIETYSTHHTELIAALSLDPRDVLGGVERWAGRGRDTQWTPSDAVRDVLLEIALTSPAVADHALVELAFAGYDPVAVVHALLAADAEDQAADFLALALTCAPGHRRRQLQDWVGGGSPEGLRVATRALRDDGMAQDQLPRSAREALRRWWQRLVGEGVALLTVPTVHAQPVVAEAVGTVGETLLGLADRTGLRLRAEVVGRPGDHAEALALLQAHPDPWVRATSTLLAHDGGDAAMTQLIDQVLFLRRTSLFREVAPDHLLKVAEQLQDCTFESGEVLVEQGTPSPGIHLIRRGRVEVVQDRERGPVPLFALGPSQCVGELSALTGDPAHATSRALEATDTWLLTTDLLTRLLHQHPRMAVGLLQILSRQVAMTTALVTSPGRR